MRLHLNPINARRNQSTRAAKEVGGSDRLCALAFLQRCNTKYGVQKTSGLFIHREMLRTKRQTRHTHGLSILLAPE